MFSLEIRDKDVSTVISPGATAVVPYTAVPASVAFAMKTGVLLLWWRQCCRVENHLLQQK